MPSLRILSDEDGWAYQNEALALQKYAPADFEVSLAALLPPDGVDAALGTVPVDLVFLLGASHTAAVRDALQRRGWRSRLVVGWCGGFPHRIGLFHHMRSQADAWIINNQGCWDATGRLLRTYMIPNGVDLEIFTVTEPLDRRRPKVLWVGSERKRRLQGYEELALPLQEKLRARDIACDLLLLDSDSRHRRTPQEMADWYNGGTVLVCTSASEGMPNPALEAAACGCTVVAPHVGTMPELIRHDVNGYLVERDIEALTAAVELACANHARLAAQMQEDIRGWHWAGRSADFFALFRALLEGRDQARVSGPDLSHAVTVFVTTVGAPSFPTCLAHLREQDCEYTLRIIDRVAPMDAAFQRMLDECRTPYYVQVDEDMLLYPHAVRTLYETMTSAAPEVAIVAADLYDAHVERCIIGVKIFRHEIVRRYPFASVDEFEMRQVARLEEDGYTVLRTTPGPTPVAGRTLGVHGTDWTPQSIYERYATLERRRRAYPPQLRWFQDHPAVFLRRFLDDPSELNFFALLGVIAGTLASPTAGGKDYRTYDELPGFRALRRFLADFERPTEDTVEDRLARPRSRASGSRHG